MAQFSLSNFDRFLLSTEDDANSPITEEYMQQIRTNLVGLLLLMLDTNVSGTVTGISGAVLTDTGDCGSIVNDWTLLITSGTAKGNIYTIDAHDADTITCTGDNLETDGVSIGDTWKALFDCKANLDGHDHDGVNTKGTVGIVEQTAGKTWRALEFTGAWDMDAGDLAPFAHGLTYNKIRLIYCIIDEPTGDTMHPLDYSSALGAENEGWMDADATNINLKRRGGGLFDAAAYNDAVYHCTIWYEV